MTSSGQPLALLSVVLLGILVLGSPDGVAAQSARDEPAAGAFSLRGSTGHRLRAQAGVFDLAEEGKGRLPKGRAFSGGLELRFGPKILHWGSAVGVFAHHDGGVFGYGGLYLEVVFGRWTLSPLLSVGGYHRGDGKDLGGVLEFHSGASLTWELASGARLGLSLMHVSNASIHEENPGAEVLHVVYDLPPSFGFGGKD